MATKDDDTYLLYCTLCNAKITSYGTVVGGNESCAHKFQPIVKDTCIPSPINTERIRHWLNKIDQNKEENRAHCAKFREDLNELNQCKSSAINHVSSIIKKIKAKLDEREQQLTHQLSDAFEERRHRIWDNIKILTQHRIKNEEAKIDSCTEASKPGVDEEKVIVESCQHVINTTPNLKHIETELRCTFDSLQRMEQYISEFGILCTQPLDSGKDCTFQSVTDVVKRKVLEVPPTKIRQSVYDQYRNCIKIGFKIHKSEPIDDDINVMNYLKIHVLCAQDNDDDENDEMFIHPIHEQYISLKDCESKGSMYMLYLNHIFDAGKCIAFKIRAIFESPNETKYESVNGKWSRMMTIEVPEVKEPRHISMIVVYLGTKKRVVLKNNSKKQIYEYKIASLREKISRKFQLKLDYKYFDLKSDDGALIQMDADIIKSWFCSGHRRCREYQIVPYVEALLFGFIRNIECANVGSEIIQMIFQWFSGDPGFRLEGRHWNCWKETEKPQENEDNETSDSDRSQSRDAIDPIPSRIVLIIRFNDIKIRIVLKHISKKHINEFTMDVLVRKLMQRLQQRGLKVPFIIKTDKGHVIGSDDDIVRYLCDYRGELEITNTLTK